MYTLGTENIETIKQYLEIAATFNRMSRIVSCLSIKAFQKIKIPYIENNYFIGT